MKLPKEDQLREIIGTAVGHGSMCWNPPPSTQVFDSTEASAAVDDAVNKIRDLAEFELVEPDRNMTFGQAITALKGGKSVAREGWNGKGMFLFLLPAGIIPKTAIYDPKLREILENNGKDHFEALGSIRMKTADDKILTGWLASQTDILAEDWMIHV